jgi:hypothetical protein
MRKTKHSELKKNLYKNSLNYYIYIKVMTQPIGIGIPVPSIMPHDLYNNEELRLKILDLEDTSHALFLFLDPIARGQITMHSSGMSLIELITPATILASNIYNNLKDLHTRFQIPSVQGIRFGGKTLKVKQRKQRKTKRKKLKKL